MNINEINAHTATINVSPDGQHLYLYISKDKGGNVYESSLIGEVWGEPVLMSSSVNSDAWETHIASSADGQTMYFVSDRSGGEGGKDIYRSVILPNGEWKSIMTSQTWLITDFYVNDLPKREYYLNELFEPSTGIPAWAR